MKKGVYRRDVEILKFVIAVVIFLIVFAIVYYLFFYTKTCQDQECFSRGIVECERVEWINDAEEAIWFYNIKGQSEKQCEVEVKLLTVKKGKVDMGEAEGKSMLCYLSLNTMTSPGEDLEKCTGPLKEELQSLIIKRMHSYVLENLGEISEEMTKPI
jgi:hypothetical protein